MATKKYLWFDLFKIVFMGHRDGKLRILEWFSQIQYGGPNMVTKKIVLADVKTLYFVVFGIVYYINP